MTGVPLSTRTVAPPPVASHEPPFRVMLAFTSTWVAAVNSCICPLLAVMSALIRISFAAVRKRVPVPMPAVLVMGAATVIVPNWMPVLPVVTSIVVSEFSAALITATSSVELSVAAGMKYGATTSMLSMLPGPAWMVTLWGSSNHRPPRPAGAETLGAEVTSR